MLLVASSLVWVDAQRCVDTVVGGSKLEGGPARGEPGADCDHAAHADLARTRECALRVLERIEVRVGIDHTA